MGRSEVGSKQGDRLVARDRAGAEAAGAIENAGDFGRGCVSRGVTYLA